MKAYDSYVIRIYRRDDPNGTALTGFVQRIGNGERQAIGNSQQLWAFLTKRHLPRIGTDKGKRSKGHSE